MQRRLYFLFPDEVHARHAVDTLLDEIGIDARHIHALTRNESGIARLPRPTARQRNNTAARTETWVWNGNLWLFTLALMLFVVALVSGVGILAVVTLAIMIATFVIGFLFTSHVPQAQLDQFHDAIAHGEVVIMLDVPRTRVKEVEDYMHHRHPEAVVGGVSWSIDAFGL